MAAIQMNVVRLTKIERPRDSVSFSAPMSSIDRADYRDARWLVPEQRFVGSE